MGYITLHWPDGATGNAPRSIVAIVNISFLVRIGVKLLVVIYSLDSGRTYATVIKFKDPRSIRGDVAFYCIFIRCRKYLGALGLSPRPKNIDVSSSKFVSYTIFVGIMA